MESSVINLRGAHDKYPLLSVFRCGMGTIHYLCTDLCNRS